MVTYPRNENDGGHLERCAVCEAVVAGWGYGNTVCADCGMTLVEPPFEGSEYLEIIMSRGRRGRAARLRRPG